MQNVSDDGSVFKETKLLIYYIRGNYGIFTKMAFFYAKQLFFAEILETFDCLALLISQSLKNFLQNQIVSWN